MRQNLYIQIVFSKMKWRNAGSRFKSEKMNLSQGKIFCTFLLSLIQIHFIFFIVEKRKKSLTQNYVRFQMIIVDKTNEKRKRNK